VNAPVKVLVIDDSALIRQLLTEILGKDKRLEVVGSAPDPFIAREKIKRLNPDVVTLDVEMPKMDGITFLKNLMRLRPMPVVMVSTMTEAGGETTLEALALGAVDFVTKPKIDVRVALEKYAEEIREKVFAAAAAKVRPLTEERARERTVVAGPVGPARSADAVLPAGGAKPLKTTDKIIAIGASTGGTEAIKEVLMALPPDAPAVMITQHIPAAFSAPFANRLNNCSALNVSEAVDGQQVLPGHAYVAPGDKHMMLKRSGARYYVVLNDGPPVNRHKPSVDVLFRSVALNAGRNALGVILTGMGADGAAGLVEMKNAGAYTLAQDEATSVVWGMPGEAVKRGAAAAVLPLEAVAQALIDRLTAEAA